MFPPGSDSSTNGITVAGGNGGGSAANQLNSPIAVYVDTAGYLYVADNYNYRIQKFPPHSTSATSGVTVAGGNGNGSALNQMYYAEGVFLDQAGNIYVADGGNNRILMFPPNSTSATFGTIVGGGNGAGTALNQLYFPRGVTVDALGNVYATDMNRIIKFPAGSSSSTFGTVVAGTGARGPDDVLNTPIGSLIFDSTGTYMYVDDDLDYRIRRYGFRAYYAPSVAGNYTATFTSSLGCVSAVSNQVSVHSLPAVTLTWDSLVRAHDLGVFGGNDTAWGLVCYAYQPPNIFPLVGGYPTGGSYSGAFVYNDTINFQTWNVTTITDTIYYTYTDNNGCSATSINSFQVTDCDGIKTIPGETTISLYPNPNTGSFMLQSTNAIGKEYIVSDMVGRVIAKELITSNQQSILLQNISAGSYMLEIKGANEKALRFMVE